MVSHCGSDLTLYIKNTKVRSLIGIALNVQINLGSIADLNNIKLSSSCTWDVVPFIEVFNFFQQYFSIFSVQVLYLLG